MPFGNAFQAPPVTASFKASYFTTANTGRESLPTTTRIIGLTTGKRSFEVLPIEGSLRTMCFTDACTTLSSLAQTSRHCSLKSEATFRRTSTQRTCSLSYSGTTTFSRNPCGNREISSQSVMAVEKTSPMRFSLTNKRFETPRATSKVAIPEKLSEMLPPEVKKNLGR